MSSAHTNNQRFIFSSMLVLLLAILACNITQGVDLDVDAAATSVALTVQAAPGNNQSPLIPVTIQAVTPVGSASGSNVQTPIPPPTPTGRPTQAASASDKTAPVISNVNTSATKVYYQNGCGPTAVTIYADASDDSGNLAQVWVNYQYLSYSAGIGGNQWYQANMASTGGKQYQVTIDVTAYANGELKGNDGTMQYQIFAMDAAGNIQTEPDGFVYGVEVWPCGGGAQAPGGAPSGAPGGASSSSISITNIQLYPKTEVYYGPCVNEITNLNVQATIDPLDQIASATIYYGYSSAAGSWGNYSTPMYQLGIGDYAGDIDAGAEAPNVMGMDDGAIDFYIQVVDKNGMKTDTPLMSMSLFYCSGGVVGQPPVAPEPDIRYFLGPVSAAPGDMILLEWEVWDACKVFLDNVEVNATDTHSYFVDPNEGNALYTHFLTAWGASCDNTSEKWTQVDIQIIPSGAGNNPGGGAGGTVTFTNNSSHPVVELLIDGQDVILSEAQTIMIGHSLDVQVSGGNHTYAAGVGFWSGGQKQAYYPLPTGSFTDQSGSVTLSDPTLPQMLTNYGQGGYYAGEFWDENTIIHCAAFDFYANGGFDFYIDNGLSDSGYYYLVSHNSGVYSVTFRVENAAGTEWFDGTYYYTGPMAGMIQMPNGPPSWSWIEYVWNGWCP